MRVALLPSPPEAPPGGRPGEEWAPSTIGVFEAAAGGRMSMCFGMIVQKHSSILSAFAFGSIVFLVQFAKHSSLAAWFPFADWRALSGAFEPVVCEFHADIFIL